MHSPKSLRFRPHAVPSALPERCPAHRALELALVLIHYPAYAFCLLTILAFISAGASPLGLQKSQLNQRLISSPCRKHNSSKSRSFQSSPPLPPRPSTII